MKRAMFVIRRSCRNMIYLKKKGKMEEKLEDEASLGA